MDLSLLLSVVALVVSVVLSTITLWLTEFRGPNITFLSSPEFEVNDKAFEERTDANPDKIYTSMVHRQIKSLGFCKLWRKSRHNT